MRTLSNTSSLMMVGQRLSVKFKLLGVRKRSLNKLLLGAAREVSRVLV